MLGWHSELSNHRALLASRQQVWLEQVVGPRSSTQLFQNCNLPNFSRNYFTAAAVRARRRGQWLVRTGVDWSGFDPCVLCAPCGLGCLPPCHRVNCLLDALFPWGEVAFVSFYQLSSTIILSTTFLHFLQSFPYSVQFCFFKCNWFWEELADQCSTFVDSENVLCQRIIKY